MPQIVLYSILIIIFLCFSAFFSGMEAAIFSLSRFRVKTLLFEDRKGAVHLEKIKKEPGRTLAALLLSNLIVNIAASSIAALVLLEIVTTHRINATLSFIIEFIMMTSLLLIFGEITPKTIAVSNAEFLSLKFARIVSIISTVFKPVSLSLETLTRWIGSHPGIQEQKAISDKELEVMLSEAKKFKVLDEGEERLGYQILKFGKIRVKEIMTPRQKVIGIPIDATVDEAQTVIRTEKHSRICVFDREGNVAGILYAKDLFVSPLARGNGELSIRSLMHEPSIVHETKYAETLLAEFRKRGIHISIVVDEFGYFSGIITLEDILEAIFGEIMDEFDELVDLPYKRIDETTYLFRGDTSIGQLTRILGIRPFAEEGERLSGFILHYLKRIPKKKETIEVAGIEITVEEIRRRAIETVSVRKKRDTVE